MPFSRTTSGIHVPNRYDLGDNGAGQAVTSGGRTYRRRASYSNANLGYFLSKWTIGATVANLARTDPKRPARHRPHTYIA